jgi:hypothetical protein
LLGLCALSWACFHESGSALVVTDGALLLDWTLDGEKDADRCAKQGVAVVRVDVFDAHGQFVGGFEPECRAFATTISLAPGTYSATAHLADRGGAARTTPIQLASWTIQEGATQDVTLDFPASSFLRTTPTSL